MSIPAVFISYSHLDEPWKDRLVRHLGIAEKQGLLQTWNDRDLLGGDDWFAEIVKAIEHGSVAVLLVSHNSLTSGFILSEEAPRMLARHKVQAARFYPIVVEYCDWEAVEWLKRFNLRPRDVRPVGINKKGERTEEQINYDLAEIAKEIRLAPPLPSTPPTPDPLTGECPYLGLEAFTEDKEHLFFGRDDFADALFAKVKRQNFVALVGPSGCGKSSLVQAGLFPRLRRDAQKWETILFPPSEDPFLSLAAGFVWRWQPQANYAVNTNEAKKLATELKDAQRLIEAIHRTVAAPDGRLLLIVDQFEEMFTLCDEGDRRAFLGALLEVKESAPMTILLTLRADFMGQAQSFSPTFSQLLDESIVSHRPFTRDDLKAVITRPAWYAGLEFEPGLVNLILQDAQPDSLPLLEYALREMWRTRQSRVIRHALYEEVGRVEGAISQHADAVLQALPEAEQALALRALTRLVRVAGEEGEADTRLRLSLSELPEAERAVLQTFVTARLLVTKREEGDGVETIEVAHEALIRRWGKLREVVDINREFLMWRQRLDSRMKEWEQKGRDEIWLLHPGERNDAQRWLSERGMELTDAEFEFITWDDRPDFQIERILSESPSLLLFSDDKIREDWFATLVFCREKEKALSIVWEIEDASDRTRALRSIAGAMVKAGMITEAHEAMTEALAAALEIEDASNRPRALSSIAEAMVKAGMMTEALAAALEIEDASYRAGALSSIAEAMVKAGMMTEALTAALEIEEARFRTRALSSIAEAMVKAGMMTEALAAALEIEDAFDRAWALNSIAEALVEAEMVATAREVTTEALAAAREIKTAYFRARALSSIAEALVEAEMVAEAREATTEALAAARKIEDASYRARALSSIAEALVEAEMVAEAREVTTEALAAACEIEDASSRPWALSSIAEAMAKAGMMTEALAAARKIENAFDRTRVLRSIAEAMAKAGMMTEALAAARKIENAFDRPWALRSIAEAMAKAGMMTEALAAARKIENAFARTRALSSIAEALAKAGMLMEALAAACEIEDASFRPWALSSIAEALAKAGIITEAPAAARKIEDASHRARALSSIAEAMAKAGMMTEALDATREIEDATHRARALSSIAKAMVEAEMVLEAREVMTEALAAAREIEGASHRAGALSSIAKAMAKAGMITEALAAACKIEDASYRAGALSSIAESLVEAGMVVEAREVTTEALAAARVIEDATHRARALSSIAEAMAKAGMMTEALAAAREIENQYSRARALMAVANFWLEQRQDDEARNILEEAQGAISKVFDDKSRSRVTERLAVILARLHSYRAAREAAEQCSSSSDRLAAYTAILREYHIDRDPSLARLFVEEEVGED